jgi:putative membrane protein
MKRLVPILATLSLAFAGVASAPAAAPQAQPTAAPVIALHQCKGTRYVHAVIEGKAAQSLDRQTRMGRCGSARRSRRRLRYSAAMGRLFLIGLLVAWGVNIIALIVIDWLFDGVTIDRWGPLLLGAAVLGIANAIVKPILAILTFPLIIVTLGLFYFLLNIAMLALAEWITPDFSIDGFWTYVGSVIVIWLVNLVLSRLFDSVAAD